ncbi:MAG: sodium:proton antiporter [Myxococcota bacterium]
MSLALALAVGVIAQTLARHVRIPGIVLLLLAGVALGPDGFGWIQPRSLGEGLLVMVDLAVAVILFEGGLNLQASRLRREQGPIRRLVTVGALITLLGGGLAAWWLLGWSVSLAVLFGSLVVVTGPTVVGPIVASLRLRSRPATVLEAEGVLIDPVGAILALLVLEIVLAPGAGTVATSVRDGLLRFAFGGAVGIVAGYALGRLLRLRNAVPEGFGNIFVLAFVLLLFESCEAVVSLSGLVAVTFAGVAMGNMETRIDRDLREFKEEITILLIGLIFVMLAADIRLADVEALGLPGLGVVAALVFVVRPITVALCTLGSELDWRERSFIAWMAPRGIVAAAVASVVAVKLDAAGMPGGTELRALVFLTIAVTVLQAGLGSALVGKWLGVRLPGRDSVAILGVHALSLALARALRDAGKPVVFLDSNPQNVRRAEEEGFPVVFGNAVLERTLQRGGFERVQSVLGLTANLSLNAVFVERAHSRFGVPETFVVTVRGRRGLSRELVEKGDARALFDAPIDLERWEVRERRGEIEVGEWRFDGLAPGGDGSLADDSPGEDVSLALCLLRGETLHIMSQDLVPEVGDVATLWLHEPSRGEAERILATRGWTRLSERD